jgi:hypothetical protein
MAELATAVAVTAVVSSIVRFGFGTTAFSNAPARLFDASLADEDFSRKETNATEDVSVPGANTRGDDLTDEDDRDAAEGTIVRAAIGDAGVAASLDSKMGDGNERNACDPYDDDDDKEEEKKEEEAALSGGES